MIPKVFHYCWFGTNKLPPLALKCIESWKRISPDYGIKLWNESNFDLEQYPYAKMAYEAKKFAYVTDVCRLHALKEEGGVYMDSDVELLKPLDIFLETEVAFSGFEDNDFVPTGMMASVKEGKWVSELLSFYDNESFLGKDGTFNLTTNTQIITQIMLAKGILMNNSKQSIPGYVTFYPSEFFCPKSHSTGIIKLSKNAHCIHHFAGSWLPKKNKLYKKLYQSFVKLTGEKNFQSLRRIKKKIFGEGENNL